jgi:hypothetical protein
MLNQILSVLQSQPWHDHEMQASFWTQQSEPHSLWSWRYNEKHHQVSYEDEDEDCDGHNDDDYDDDGYDNENNDGDESERDCSTIDKRSNVENSTTV